MDSDEEMEIDEPMMVFEVTEIDLDYEFDASRWFDFTVEESPSDSGVAELWFETAPSYPPSPFAIKLLMRDDVVSDYKTDEPSSVSEHEEEVAVDVHDRDGEISQQSQDVATDVNETGDGTKSEVFTFIHGGSLKKVPDQSLNKGNHFTFSKHIHADKAKGRSNSSTRPIPRSSTLMKPTASQLAKQGNARLHVKENGLCPASLSEVQAAKRQKLDGGLLHKVAETKQEVNFVHKALKKDKTLDRNSHHARTKITIPQEPDFATSHRANRIRHKDDAKLDQDSTSVYRFKARPFNRKIFEAPSLPIRKKSTPKLPEFQEFQLKTSERAMQHSSAVSTSSYQGNNYHKGPEKPDSTGFLDGVNREPRRPRATNTPKDDDRKHTFIAHPHNNKISSRRDNGIISKSKPETTVSLEVSLYPEKKTQLDLPTNLFSKLSIKSELQPDNGSRLRPPQPELVKGSKENRHNSFEAGNERTSKVTGKPMVQRGIGQWSTRR
ncbi:unnamed protein product [Cochlearia groenlandica]